MNEMHIKEDTAKPENRINLSFFHLMMVDEIRNYVLDKLNISRGSVMFPSPNLTTEEFDLSCRPDFAITIANRKIGFIEIEIGGEDSKQLQRYRSEQPLPVYSIIGKRSYGPCDLSLEELYHYLKSIHTHFIDSQVAKSIHLLCSLIEYYVIQGKVSGQKPIALSDKMKDSQLIRIFYEYFGKDRILENTSVQRNKVMFNTRGVNGFSLRVFSPVANSNGLSLMNRSGGHPKIYFPSYFRLDKFLPDKNKEVENYSALIADLGAVEIYRKKENEKCNLSLDIVENNAERFCRNIDDIISISKS